MDGSDDADSLRAADISGALNQAVVDLVENRVALGRGVQAPVSPILTGDGKAMRAANFRENGPKALSCTLMRNIHQHN
jgi:hypothetical protein